MLYLLLATLVCFMVAAQTIIKQRINLHAGQQDHSVIFSMIMDPWVWLSVCLVVIAGFCWFLVLRRATLNYAYPFVAMTFVLTPIASHFVLGEALRWNQMAGAVTILAGISIAMLGGQ